MATKTVNINVTTKGAQKAQQEFKSLGGSISKVSTIMSGIFASAIVAGGFKLSKMSAEAEGVRIAFGRLNKPELLDNLRKATKGTVSDIELMRRAVSANNFKISLEQLPTLLKFAQQRARETGESVDYLVNSIVTGIGRKSPLILDNLGLSAIEVRDEFKKTGDMAKAVGNIINREFAKSGELGKTTADIYDEAAAKLENFSLKTGDLINYILKQTGAMSQQSGVLDALGDLWNDLIDRALPGVRIMAEAESWKQLNQEVKKHEETIKATLTPYQEWVAAFEEKQSKDAEELEFLTRYNQEWLNNANLINGPVLDGYERINIEFDNTIKKVNAIKEVSSDAGKELVAMANEIESRNDFLFGNLSGMLNSSLQQSKLTFKKIGDAWVSMLTRMAIELAAKAAIFGFLDLVTGGSFSAGRSFTERLFGFQTGGSFTVGGQGGPDSQLVAFRASPGERVSITPEGQTNNSLTINFNGNVTDQDYVRDMVIPEIKKAIRRNEFN